MILPDFVIHLILTIGIIGTIIGYTLGMLPFVKYYQLPIQIVATILLVFSVYLEGGISERKANEMIIADLKFKLVDSEIRAASINNEIQSRVITNTKVITQRGEDIIHSIDREITKYDQTCSLPKEVITSHNLAARNSGNLEESLRSNSVINSDVHNKLILPSKSK